MATVEEPRAFIRPDGKEKVTGTGRYTADLVLAGGDVAARVEDLLAAAAPDELRRGAAL